MRIVIDRYPSLDLFRGFAVLMMILYNLIPLFSDNVPLILQHGREDGLLFGDLAAPFFLYIMGVALTLSVNRRAAKGQAREEINRHVLMRSVKLFLIGWVLDITVFRSPFTWGVLETLALSYCISYFLLRYGIEKRLLLVSIMYISFYIIASHAFLIQFIRNIPHGGPLSTLSWTPLTIFGALSGEYLERRKSSFQRFLLTSGSALMFLGVLISPEIPFNKRLVSVSYSLFSSGASSLMLLLFYQLTEKKSNTPSATGRSITS